MLQVRTSSHTIPKHFLSCGKFQEIQFLLEFVSIPGTVQIPDHFGLVSKKRRIHTLIGFFVLHSAQPIPIRFLRGGADADWSLVTK